MSQRTLRERIPSQLKAVVGHSSRTFGRLTASSRILPGLLICGGQRCGTTSLYRALAQHPAIMKPVFHKGVHYFDTNYERGISWYRGHFPTQAASRRIADHTGLAPIGFESSPYYLYHPLAAERFARDLPGVKVIVLVRDPVERAWSHHAHEMARGFEPIADFEEAVAAEEPRLEGVEERLLASPERTASTTSTTRTPREAGTRTSLSRLRSEWAGTGCWCSTPGSSSRGPTTRSSGCSGSWACHGSGSSPSRGTTRAGVPPRCRRRCGSS